MTSTDQEQTLFCPRCDYNLTGLAEKRCPECGEVFDPEVLRQEMDDTPKPISIPMLIRSLFWPATWPWLALALLIGAMAIAPSLAVFSVLFLLLKAVTVGSLIYQVVRISMLSKRLVARLCGPQALRRPGGLVACLAILVFLPAAVLTVAPLFYLIGALGEL